MHLRCGASGRAVVPIGARGRTAHGGVHEIATVVDAALHGLDVRRSGHIDASLTRLNTYSPMRVGADVLAACSIAALRAAAEAAGQPLFRYLRPEAARVPRVMATTLVAAAPDTALARLSVMPIAAAGAEEALDACAAVHAAVAAASSPPPRGAVPSFEDDERGLDALATAIERAGLVPGGEIVIAAELNALRDDASARGPRGELLAGWVERYPIAVLEDRFAAVDRACAEPHARAGFGSLLRVGSAAPAACDAGLLGEHGGRKLCGAIIAVPEQAGTASEVLAAFEAARRAGWDTAVAADAIGAEDAATVHLAVGWGAGILKLGSVADGASAARWNELLRIDAALARGTRRARRRAAAHRVH